MALTLLEAKKLSNDPIQSAVIETFARESEVLRVLPFQDIQGNALRYNVETSLPGIAFRGVNEAYSESTGVLNPVTEALVIAGGDLDVDKFIVDTEGQKVRAVHELMKIKALAAGVSLKFIKGDSTSDPREFDGLQVRLTGNQVISNSSSGAALSLAKLDQAIDAVDNPTHIFMNVAMRRRMTAAARDTSVGGFITFSQDEFGRQIAKYNDLPILTLTDAMGADNILPFTEACTAGSPANCTSIYIVSIGEGKVKGLQNGPLSARDLGELETKPVFRTRVEWYVAMAVMHGRAAARLRDIQDAAVTK